ncbi:MAG: tripartite tricarboxylate transporter TctB family protein [Armatimonadota bacterium]|nr:tripartite tricarboxylate transporter TctB family protein [Armatimonadota bacterium]MDR7534420.1 tripartite tricarboxylate transporter TctB family protein [Armatimonadota bacterium]MDR7535731.1 tripartite tricarboxylate transporter TctB family protein [Armatimonadota bacterium]
MRPSGHAVFATAVALLAAWALAETASWPIKTALYPRVIGVPLLALAAAEAVLCLRRQDDAHPREAMDVELSRDVPPAVALRRTLTMVAWMGGFFLAIALVGFPRAVPLFVFAYLRGQAREGWAVSLAMPVLAWLGFWLLFVRLLHLPFADGWLWGALLR